MIRCKSCGKPVGKGRAMGGDTLQCVECAKLYNKARGKLAVREDPATIREQMRRPRSWWRNNLD